MGCYAITIYFICLAVLHIAPGIIFNFVLGVLVCKELVKKASMTVWFKLFL